MLLFLNNIIPVHTPVPVPISVCAPVPIPVRASVTIPVLYYFYCLEVDCEYRRERVGLRPISFWLR